MLRWAGSFSSKQPLDQLPLGFEDTTVLAHDEAWMRRLLDEPSVANAIDVLVEHRTRVRLPDDPAHRLHHGCHRGDRALAALQPGPDASIVSR